MNQSPFERTYDVEEECTVVIKTTSGDVEVSGWDEPQVKVRSSDGAAVRQDGSRLIIKPRMPGATDLSVCVPRECDLVLRLKSGAARLEGVAGDISLRTVSGDVTGEGLGGDVRVRTVSGGVLLRDSRLTDLTIRTVSGDSVIESQLDEGGSYRMYSVSGNLRLMIPEDQGCTIHSRSLSGEFECSLPHEVRRASGGALEAPVNGGGVEFRVRTTSGNVAVEPAGGLSEPGSEPIPRQPVATVPLEWQEPETEREPFGLDEATGDQEGEGSSLAAQRMEILRAIEEGRMSVGEGLTKLRSLD